MVKGKPIKESEIINFNPEWMLAVTSDGSRYWIHRSGKVVTIVEK